MNDPKPLEPEAYTVAIYFFHLLLLLFFLGSSYLGYSNKPMTIQPTLEVNNERI